MLQVITILSIVLLIAIDQIFKLLAIEYLEPLSSFPVLDGIIQLRYAENTGAAFGSFSGYTTILSVFTSIILVVALYFLLSKKIPKGFYYVCTTLIIAGGIGNLIDRIFRGYVVDYIEPLFVNFAIFNFADILVTCGAIVLVIWTLYDIYRDEKKARERYKK